MRMGEHWYAYMRGERSEGVRNNCLLASAVRRSGIFCRELDSERRRRLARRYRIWEPSKTWKLITYLYVFPFQLFQVSQVSAHVMPITPCFAKARRRDGHRLALPQSWRLAQWFRASNISEFRLSQNNGLRLYSHCVC